MRRRERTLSASLEIGHYPVPEKYYPGLCEILASVFCCLCNTRYQKAEDAYSSDSDDAVYSNDNDDSDSDDD